MATHGKLTSSAGGHVVMVHAHQELMELIRLMIVGIFFSLTLTIWLFCSVFEWATVSFGRTAAIEFSRSTSHLIKLVLHFLLISIKIALFVLFIFDTNFKDYFFFSELLYFCLQGHLIIICTVCKLTMLYLGPSLRFNIITKNSRTNRNTSSWKRTFWILFI